MRIRHRYRYRINYATPIPTIDRLKVIRYGVLPGCTLPTATFETANGHRFVSDIASTSTSYDVAHRKLIREVKASIQCLRRSIWNNKQEISRFEKMLDTLENEDGNQD